MENKPLVSVCLITYNHEQFIEKAIQSVIDQKVNFQIELIIAEDCSKDGTRAILTKYHDKYPHLIRLILQEKNVGPAKNWFELIHAPVGKYIAYFEGDDYWSDPNKLQKQVDFLEKNPDYSICFHGVHELREGKIQLPEWQKLDKETYTIEELAQENFIYTLTVMVRNVNLKFPVWFNDSPVGDYVWHMLNARMGKIKYMPESMAVYRKHNAGIWTGLDPIVSTKRWITVLDFMISEFDGIAKENLIRQKNKYINDLKELKKSKFRKKIDSVIKKFVGSVKN